MYQQQKPSKSNNDVLRYAGLGAQILVSLGIAVWLGLKADQLIHISFPLLVWLLPFLVLAMMIYKLIKETSKDKADHDPEKK